MESANDAGSSRTRERRAATIVLAAGVLASAFALGGCAGGDDTPGSAASTNASETIPQPGVTGLPVAPQGARVDLRTPTFSNPTRITNRLFPVSRQTSVLLLGQVDGLPFRTEVTLLPETRIIEWQGQQVETLVSQYVAFLGRRLHEVALDFYAQDDDGAVWYFGEDVFNFKDGAIVDTHGTWIAGKDGPAAMIMPAEPKVGDVYRPENIPGFVFEEVTVTSVEQTIDGHLGPIEGAIVVQELHLDGSTETKTFAPGYGEFFTDGSGDVEALDLAVPTDALSEPTPAALVTLERGAAHLFDAAESKTWRSARRTVARMSSAWDIVRAGKVPRRHEPRLASALARLDSAVDAGHAARARQAAIDVAQLSLDLQLRHRPATEIDRARFDLWTAQLLVDAAAGDAAAVTGDLFTLDYIRDRIQHTLGAAEKTRFNAVLEKLQGAIGDDDLAAAAEAARQLREIVGGFAPAG